MQEGSSEKEGKGQEITQKLTPFSWQERLFTAMIFSAIGTGLWLLLHWGVLRLLGHAFDKHRFMLGRGTWLDLLPYVLSVPSLLSFALEKFLEDKHLKNLFMLLRTLIFVVSIYILLINYLYWVKHSL